MLKQSIIRHIKHFKLKEYRALRSDSTFHKEKHCHGDPANKLQEEVHLDDQAGGKPDVLSEFRKEMNLRNAQTLLVCARLHFYSLLANDELSIDSLIKNTQT